MATRGTVTVTIAAPPESVWTWVADITRHGEWSPKPYRVEIVAGELNTVGSRYRSIGWVPPKDSNHENDVEITEVVPVTRFALAATDSNGTFTNMYDLKPVDGGTEVTYQLIFPAMKGMAAIMVPIVFPLVGMSDLKKRMQLLKQKVESAP
jgi:uncharacterized protein YndB with AHSA1/START domain